MVFRWDEQIFIHSSISPFRLGGVVWAEWFCFARVDTIGIDFTDEQVRRIHIGEGESYNQYTFQHHAIGSQLFRSVLESIAEFPQSLDALLESNDAGCGSNNSFHLVDCRKRGL